MVEVVAVEVVEVVEVNPGGGHVGEVIPASMVCLPA
jgi:hypothetical protein